MTTPVALTTAVAASLDAGVRSSHRVSGGDINDAYRFELADSTVVFVKSHPSAPAGMYHAEAAGLDWLRDGEVRVPEVLAVIDPGVDAAPPARLLVLEWIESASPAADHDEALGRGLAALHLAGARHFGNAGDVAPRDNFIGSLPQCNAPHDGWPSFYAAERIEPLVRRAIDAGTLPTDTRGRFDRFCAGLPRWCGPAEAPARLHGDLWGGNAMTDERGAPVLVDPAVYGGHREMDLAMMQLFGGFTARVFDAYDEAHPRADGHQERVALHQLYPLLVHLVLFGASYAQPVLRALARYE